MGLGMCRVTCCAVGLALALACSNVQPRGRVAAVTTRAKDLPMQIVERDAAGKTCRLPHQLDAAVDAALESAPGANALINVNFRVKAACLEARGTAVRVGSAAAGAPPPGP
jgi:hypothetical protein